jgi:hypothetical protein
MEVRTGSVSRAAGERSGGSDEELEVIVAWEVLNDGGEAYVAILEQYLLLCGDLERPVEVERFRVGRNRAYL